MQYSMPRIVDVDDLVPGRGRALAERPEDVPPGVVDEHAGRAEPGLEIAEGARHLGLVGDVGRRRRGPPAGLRHGLAGRVGAGPIAIEHADRKAIAREPECERAPDSARAACDHRY